MLLVFWHGLPLWCLVVSTSCMLCGKDRTYVYDVIFNFFRYNRLAQQIRSLAVKIKNMNGKDSFQGEATKQLLEKLYGLRFTVLFCIWRLCLCFPVQLLLSCQVFNETHCNKELARGLLQSRRFFILSVRERDADRRYVYFKQLKFDHFWTLQTASSGDHGSQSHGRKPQVSRHLHWAGPYPLMSAI